MDEIWSEREGERESKSENGDEKIIQIYSDGS
jgi:hypothetical protein